MSEFIGSRISLISKSDIRYVGTLHEINSENSTVALENVTSFGTEGRRIGDEEIPASDNVYEYIVFRGSDVKDLRIEEPAKETKPPPPPTMPNDPAILGAARPQPPQGPPQGPPQNQAPPPQQQQQQRPPQGFPPPGPPGQFPPGYPPYGPPFQNQRFGPPGGFPPGPGGFPGYPGGPGGPGGYGGPPPPWYGPPGQGFPHQPPGPGPFSPQPPVPIGPPGQHNQQQPPLPPQGPKGAQAAPIGPSASKEENPNFQTKVAEADGTTKAPEPKSLAKPASQATPPAPAAAPKKAPTPPVESKPDVAAALAPAQTLAPPAQPTATVKTTPSGPKSGRIVPAVPIPSPRVAKAAAHTTPTTQAPAAQPSQAAINATSQYQNATQAATAAVAAAMAKLGPAPGQKGPPAVGRPQGDAMDNLTKQVNAMRTDESIRHGRQQGTGGYASGNRGPRAPRGGRGGPPHQAAKIEIPTTDYDFASANAKFNKKDLAKEAIASGSPIGGEVASPPPVTEAPTNGHSTTNGTAEKAAEVVIPASTYDKGSSFFDNISSELKDREEAMGRRLGGQEFRTEERKRNLETFGQGSVDNYRGGYRGRGRGRGFGRGRGGFRGRGGTGGTGVPRGRGLGAEEA
ncbi:hypothetical protein BU16DRAFT_529854 [Lophium mytilinum]|uniref:TFG box profile domain-containing protein n=1 Tax=Lophium mytilinum TaxID=390894 RepID=A0A6A6QI23_9PEZI|nr:hypothetical protein BU16DRAFT_529854 [Lophium mytilinum]